MLNFGIALNISIKTLKLNKILSQNGKKKIKSKLFVVKESVNSKKFGYRNLWMAKLTEANIHNQICAINN